jgi:hypothetical protein
MAKKVFHGRKRIIIAFVALFSLAGVGIAFAYWTSSGSGDGTATTGESTAFEITVDPAVGTIAPGNAGQTVDFHVANPSDDAQYLSDVTATMADADGTAWVPPEGCDIADFTVDMTSPAPSGDIAGGNSVDGTVTVTLTNTTENQDACQGQTVPLHFVAA